MKIKFLIATPPQKGINADLLIVFFDKAYIRRRQKDISSFPKGIDKVVLNYLKMKDFAGEFNETALIYPDGLPTIKRILFVGLGKYSDPTKEQIAELSSTISTIQKKISSKRNYALLCNIGYNKEKLLKGFVEGIYNSHYKIDKFSNRPKEKEIEHHYVFVCQKSEYTPRFRKILLTSIAYMEAIELTRDLANTPANLLPPEELKNKIKKHFSGVPGIKLSHLDEKALKDEKMNAMLAVSKGSVEKPYLLLIHYKPVKSTKKRLALVGKGVTFDSGGISIKPSASMEEMKFDMAGAAAVVGMMSFIAKMKPKYEVIGVIPAVENMPDGGALKPGDIVTAHNGKTIEVINTDAEGRLILADALSYTEKNYKPDVMIDFATLTGSSVVALGDKMAALFTANDKLAKILIKAADKSLDLLWRMPLLESYAKELESDFADIKNIGSRWGGGVTAAKFLEKFIKRTKWAHIDIAGTAYNNSNDKIIKKGATGYGVRLIAESLNTIEKIL
jgi:leucyl aminopeptidase